MRIDRRFHERIPSDLTVLITQLDNDQEWRGFLLDISDSGLCSLSSTPLTPGAVVKLEILGLTLYGHIVYSTMEDDMFRTGIFVEPALLDSSNITELVKSYLISAGGRI
ncbi:MAG: PilZ domain-containing protein [Bryobacterales bacterium]|nr:PilZ domain-containing protein [Bryobacterales bacterium]